MKNRLKGIFLSGFVCPGLGQIALEQYKRGAVFVFAVSVSLLVIFIKIVQHVFAIVEKIKFDGGVIDINSISDALNKTSIISGNIILNFFIFIILFCWIFSIIDAYKIGRKKDLTEQSDSMG